MNGSVHLAPSGYKVPEDAENSALGETKQANLSQGPKSWRQYLLPCFFILNQEATALKRVLFLVSLISTLIPSKMVPIVEGLHYGLTDWTAKEK